MTVLVNLVTTESIKFHMILLDVLYTLFLMIPQQPHPPHDLLVTPHIDHSDPTWVATLDIWEPLP